MNLIYDNKPFKKSSRNNLNFIFEHEDIYLMDNHLAALWCWEQHKKKHDLTNMNSILHIDYHNDWDTIQSNKESLNAVKKIKNQTINKFLTESSQCQPRYNWGNYMKYYFLIDSNIHIDFFTMESKISEFKHKRLCEFFDSDYTGSEDIILNIDIDVFFTKIENTYIKVFEDNYIIEFAKIVKDMKNIPNICITIALSPECCGDWENSLKVFEILNIHANLNFDIQYIKDNLS